MRHARRRPTNVTIREDLLEEARALGINLSRTLEDRLAEIVAEARGAAWVAENGPAIEAYNARVEARGVFSDGRRRF